MMKFAACHFTFEMGTVNSHPPADTHQESRKSPGSWAYRITLALPGLLYALFILLVVSSGSRWN